MEVKSYSSSVHGSEVVGAQKVLNKGGGLLQPPSPPLFWVEENFSKSNSFSYKEVKKSFSNLNSEQKLVLQFINIHEIREAMFFRT